MEEEEEEVKKKHKGREQGKMEEAEEREDNKKESQEECTLKRFFCFTLFFPFFTKNRRENRGKNDEKKKGRERKNISKVDKIMDGKLKDVYVKISQEMVEREQTRRTLKSGKITGILLLLSKKKGNLKM